MSENEKARSGPPLTLRPGHRLRLLRDGVDIFPALRSTIGRARRSIDLECAIWGDDRLASRVAEALLERAHAGVRIRVILAKDNFRGSGVVGRLQDAGVAIRTPRYPGSGPLSRPGLRDHRALIICDGTVALMGAYGIHADWGGDSYESSVWRDTGLEVRGPVLSELGRLFEARWTREALCCDPATPDRALGDDDPRIAAGALHSGHEATAVPRAYLELVRNARREVWLTNVCFLPGRRLASALADATGRGVDVRLLLPDGLGGGLLGLAAPATLAPLLQAGARLYLWPSPMLNARTAVIDGQVGLVGSSRLAFAAAEPGATLDLIFRDEPLALVLRALFLEDTARSHRASAADLAERPPFSRLASNLARLVAHHLLS